MVQYNETSFPSLGGASSNDDWAASDDTQPQPPAKLGPVNLSSAPPAPTKPAHPPPAPYRDSKRAPPPASQPSPSGYYTSGNARMAPAQVPPVKAPPAPVLRVPLVPRSAGPLAPPPAPSGVHPFGNGRMAQAQVPPVKAPPAAVPRAPPVPRSVAPPPPPPQPYGRPSMMTNGQGPPLSSSIPLKCCVATMIVSAENLRGLFILLLPLQLIFRP